MCFWQPKQSALIGVYICRRSLDALIPKVRPLSRATTRSPVDQTSKFGTARFPASFSGQTVVFRRQPPPPQGRSRLHRSVSLLSNPSLFDRFPFVFLSPTRYPANFTMVFSVSGHLRPWPRPSSPRAWRRRPWPSPAPPPGGPHPARTLQPHSQPRSPTSRPAAAAAPPPPTGHRTWHRAAAG